MNFITLPKSGAVIDLDSVVFVIKTESKTAGSGIAVGAGGSVFKFFRDDARRFLELLRDHRGVNVDVLLKQIPVTSKS